MFSGRTKPVGVAVIAEYSNIVVAAVAVAGPTVVVPVAAGSFFFFGKIEMRNSGEKKLI